MFRRAVDLFTPDEHARFRTKPPGCAQDILPQDAAKRLGFTREPFHYLLNDAVVAYIVLEQIERQLPGWSAITDDGEFVAERHFRDVSAIPHRKVAVLPPRHLLTINWADSGPGYSWPVAYYVAWLPYYSGRFAMRTRLLFCRGWTPEVRAFRSLGFRKLPHHSIRWLRGPESIAFRRTVFAALVEAKLVVRQPRNKFKSATWHAIAETRRARVRTVSEIMDGAHKVL